jgi:acyl-[acyl-carrier-protein] desaturase
MLANWGYEESKHSMALSDWLLHARMRTDEQMADLEGRIFQQEWDLPYNNARAMVCYTMLQELATWLHYRTLRQIVRENGGDPALDQVLHLVSIDERAHYDFFRKLVALYLEDDRAGTLEQLRLVSNTFRMPAYHLLVDGQRRALAIKELRIFDYDIYYYSVFEPCMAALGVDKSELRRRSKREVVTVK